MKTLILLPAVFLFLACDSPDLVQPDPAQSSLADPPELTSAPAPSAQGMFVKMVPFKMKGTWAPAPSGDPTPCDPYPDAVDTYVESENNATHLGHITTTATNCFLIQSDGSYLLLVHAQTFRAANGDLLYGFGTADGGTEIIIHPDMSFDIVHALFAGGTGRFSNATGSYDLHGESTQGGAATIDGWISSVGSSK